MKDDRAVCMCVSVCLCVRVRLSVPDGVSGAFARISFLIKARGGDLGSNCLRVSKRFLIYWSLTPWLIAPPPPPSPILTYVYISLYIFIYIYIYIYWCFYLLVIFSVFTVGGILQVTFFQGIQIGNSVKTINPYVLIKLNNRSVLYALSAHLIYLLAIHPFHQSAMRISYF